MLASLTGVAAAHSGHSHAASPYRPASSELAREMRAYWSRAPREVGRSCTRSIAVPGLGSSCRSAGGLWRVRLSDGTTLTTHGPDASPAPQPAAYYGGDPASVTSATADDIACADTSVDRYLVLVYAYPAGQASRYGAIAPQLRQEAYGMSAFLNAESQAVDESQGKKLRLECDGAGVPIVVEAELPTSAGADSFGTVVSDLRALGYGTSMSMSARDRYAVYYDSGVGSGAAGTGHLFGDDSEGTSSLNNTGGLFAVEFNWNGHPNWDVLLHEVGHNMGAVQDSAANSSGSGHCNDGRDIMCYADGGATSSYSSSVCGSEDFDCGRNDYFNPSPAPGSYLDTHWNVAGSYNRFLEHLDLGPSSDVVAPSQPGTLAVASFTNTAATLTWSAATDNHFVTGYRVYRDGVSVGTTASLGFTLSGLTPATTYTLGVTAFDAADNESTMATVEVTTVDYFDTSAPSDPTVVGTAPYLFGATVTWDASTDDTAVDHYNLYAWDSLAATDTFIASTAGTGYTFSGLTPGTAYVYHLEAIDTSDNASGRVSIGFTTTPDTTPPTTPTSFRSINRSRSTVRTGWYRSLDNVGVHRYRLYRYQGGAWRYVGSTTAGAREFTFTSLQANTRYSFRARAVDAAGNPSGWSTILTARTNP